MTDELINTSLDSFH